MLQKGSRGYVIDNSGAKEVEVIGTLGGSRLAYLGSVVRISVKAAIPNSRVTVGSTHLAIISGTKYPYQRKDGTVIRSNGNHFILISPDRKELVGTNIDNKMYVAREVLTMNNSVKSLSSLCKEVC